MPPRAKRWEKRAELLLASMLLDDGHAGYADSLRMAGQDRDAVEADPEATAWARNTTRLGWDAALGRLVAPPTAVPLSNPGESADDAFADIEQSLRRASLGDAEES